MFLLISDNWYVDFNTAHNDVLNGLDVAMVSNKEKKKHRIISSAAVPFFPQFAHVQRSNIVGSHQE